MHAVSDSGPEILDKRRRYYRRITSGGSVLLGAMAIVVLFGWFIQSRVLVTIAPGFPAMSFNTALCFALSSVALFASLRHDEHSRKTATMAAFIALTIGVTRLGEIALFGGLSHMLDRALSGAFISSDFRDAVGGWMVASTAFTFSIINASIIFALYGSRKIAQFTQELTSYLVVMLALLSLAGYVTNADLNPTWHMLAAMALHTSIGNIVFGLALLARSWWMLPSNQARIPLWVPALLCFFGVLVDLYTPLGVANGILYVPLVMTALWFGNNYASFSFAFVSSILVFFGFLATSHDDAGYWSEFVNRSLTVALLWLIALLQYRFLQTRITLEKERVQFDALVRNAPDAIITIKQDGVIASFNPAAEEMFGYTPAETIGQNIKMLMPEPYHSEHDGYLSHYRQTGEARIIGTNRIVSGKRKSGVVFPLDLSISAIPTENRQPTYVGVVRDISDRVRQEERLRATLGQMEAYSADLERSNQDLDEFAYIASHDLKEPLRGLHNHSRFLLEDYGAQLDDDGRRRLNRLVVLTQRMEKLVNDLLYFSRIGRQQLAIQHTDIHHVVEEVIATFDFFLEQCDAEVSIEGQLPVIICDGTRVTEVFRNLIANAVKYNDKEKPLIQVGFLDRYSGSNGASVRDVFYVRDNGKGIPREFHEDIFRIFKKLEKSQSPEDGTGVGLTFVRKIVSRHRGEIWLDSTVGTGTTFYFTLGQKREEKYVAT